MALLPKPGLDLFIALGKIIDVVLTFNQPYENNLCFYRIGKVPGSKIYLHYLRVMEKKDANDEVRKYIKMAFEAENQRKK